MTRKKQENKRQETRLRSWLLNLKVLHLKMQQESKKHTYRAKGGIVEESKKGYTGDALALRGDEGRDKLR